MADLIKVIGDGHYATPLTNQEEKRDEVGFTHPNLHRRVDAKDPVEFDESDLINGFWLLDGNGNVIILDSYLEQYFLTNEDSKVICLSSSVNDYFLLDADDNVILVDDDTGIVFDMTDFEDGIILDVEESDSGIIIDPDSIDFDYMLRYKPNEYLLNICDIYSYRTMKIFTHCEEENEVFDSFEIP